MNDDGLNIGITDAMQVITVGIIRRYRIFGEKRQVGAQRQDPQRRQIQRVVHPQIERFRGDIARRPWRAAAARSRLVVVQRLAGG